MRRKPVITEDPVLAPLREAARHRQRFGYRRLTAMLQKQGLAVTHKRIYRLYREANLALRRKRRRHSAVRSVASPENSVLHKPNQRWAMDFFSDSLVTEESSEH
jgi:putative transposase